MRDFDFGFSLEDEDFVAPAKKEEIAGLQDSESRLNEVVEMILPLLNNLMASPEKPTIYWPNRSEKVEEFKSKLLEAAGMAK